MMINKLARGLFSARTSRASLKSFFGGGANGQPTLKPFPRDEASGYYLNPDEVAERMIKIATLHDQFKRPEDVTLGRTFHSLGIDELTKVEIFLEIEKEFDIEFADEDVERFKNFHDAVEHVAKSFHAR
jgi:acyl carrier protein